MALISPPCMQHLLSALQTARAYAPFAMRADKWKADLGTLLLRCALELAELCSKYNVPWLLEYPELLGACLKGVRALAS